jgi:hypothetical protein
MSTGLPAGLSCPPKKRYVSHPGLAPPHSLTSSCLIAPFWDPATGATTSTQRDEDPSSSSDEEHDNPEVNTYSIYILTLHRNFDIGPWLF